MAKKRQGLRPNSRTGVFEREIGWKWIGHKHRQHKFYLGKDRVKAELANRRLEELWDHVVAAHTPALPPFDRPLWTDESLMVGQALAKGQTQIVVEPQSHNAREEPSDPARLNFGQGKELFSQAVAYALTTEGWVVLPPRSTYAAHLHRLASTYPMVSFIPADPQKYQRSAAAEAKLVTEKMEAVRAEAMSYNRVPPQSPILLDPTDGMLHAALDEYAEYLKKEHRKTPVPGDDSQVTEWGNHLLECIERLKEKHTDRPLAGITLAIVQEMIDVWRSRPPSKRSGEPIKRKVAGNHIKLLKRFFRWLHRSDRYSWRKPQDFDELVTKVRRTDQEIALSVRPFQVQHETYGLDELAVIYRYALPFERSLVLLALNCGFQQKEISDLLIGHVQLFTAHPFAQRLGFESGDTDSYITRMRVKTSVYGEWLLWPETVTALQWARRRREGQTTITRGKDAGKAIPVTPEARLILSNDGTPLVKQTPAGHRSSRIANTWAGSLLTRIRKDYPDFATLSFGKLKKTADTAIREIAGDEVASLFVCHGTPIDNLLEAYSNRPFGRLFAALRTLRERWAKLFEYQPDWPDERKKGGPNLGVAQIDLIERLLAEGELSVIQIAKKARTTRTTVYRRKQALEARRGPLAEPNGHEPAAPGCGSGASETTAGSSP